MSTENLEVQNTEEFAVAEGQSTPNLTIQDLVQFAQIIQVSSQRGAFRAEELESVGALFNRLVAFLEASGAVTKGDAIADEAEAEAE
jgi:hypothetical protein